MSEIVFATKHAERKFWDRALDELEQRPLVCVDAGKFMCPGCKRMANLFLCIARKINAHVAE